MKNTLKLVLLFSVIHCSCKAQQMVKTTKDVYLLKTNEQEFINKPLKKLLKEIKPEIKTANPTNDNPYYFSFKFRTLEQRLQNKGSKEDRVSLYVYVKTPIDWKYDERPKGKELVWTKEDPEKYGDLIVVRIKVIQPVEE
ncbi:hypothetical protein D0809_08825 [Flavobacterium circumlabens]|uniref:Uncharacterized protein n=1 Tax=Flavobacterium circumlabens TaxID=2133765 RepID=A0A4Y7UH92_9FLAO|nr:hypothetical protein [Flavobacterium circumlabens]TCN60021.1 hypothetical protein EV142_102641 [Flavobacterium circumlabens]TEB45258.1 hypothetical protein D0809_08825 [Flavobacterium circumlabens]